MINARSIKNKLHDLHCYLTTEAPDIVCITESWLLPSCPSSLVVGDCNYTVFRKDRVGAVGGGVCILLNNNTVLGAEINVPAKYSHLELVAVDICTSLTKVKLFVCYRAPSSDSDLQAVNYTRDLCDCLGQLSKADFTTLVCGDFNLPKINWKDDSSSLFNDTCSGIFCNYFHDNCLHQFVNDATRLSSASTTAGSILDLIICNDINFVFDVCVGAPFGTSDHCVVTCKLVLESNFYNTEDFFQYDFDKADWLNITDYLNNYDFNSLFMGCSNASNSFDCFYAVLQDCISMYVPRRLISNKHTNRTRYPVKIRKFIQRKNAAWNLYKKFRTPATLFKYKQLAAECRRLVRQFTFNRESAIINGGNVGSFFRYANRKFSFKSAVGPLKQANGAVTTNPIVKAELLQSVFVSKYTVDNNVIPPLPQVPVSNKLSHIVFSPPLIKRVIRKMRAKAKGGPDAIPPIFYKTCCDQLCLPLSSLFQISFHNGYLPPVWLSAFISPAFKKGDPTDPNNYRPIALTCTACKIMESVIKEQLLNFLLCKQLISKKQHAFISRHSTATNLLECTHDWLISLSKHACVDVIYIDFSRAFDSIVYSKLLAKLTVYGIDGKLLDWFGAFLHGRVQSVVIDNCFSCIAPVISGVPQGSVLGAVLFLIFINDIESICCTDTSLQLFADDLKLYSTVTVSNCSQSLQQSLINLEAWSADWQLSINIAKCAVLRIGSKCSQNSSYVINTTPLACTESISDLGVEVDGSLSYSTHIAKVVAKATQRVGILFRGFVSRDLGMMRMAYISYIRPLLEYNSVVWNPYQVNLISRIEKVQRRFTKFIPVLHNLSYSERLATINLEPLELRRLRSDLIMYYKILHGISAIDSSSHFNYYQPVASSRTASPKLIKSIKGNNNFLYSFFNRTVDCWNTLPHELRLCDSLPVFKKQLNCTDLSSFITVL